MKSLTITVALITSAAHAMAQATCPNVLDINQTYTSDSGNPLGNRNGTGGKILAKFVPCGNRWFFSAHTPELGEELWVTDGTSSGTRLVKDIYPGSRSSNIYDITCCDDKVYFRADDGVSGLELWRSDGSETGTILLRDLNRGPGSSEPSHLECVGSYLYFAADDGVNGVELWRTDTLFFVLKVKDIVPGPRSSSPRNLCSNSTGTLLYFAAQDGSNGHELWRSDGSEAGTRMIGDLYPGARGSNPGELTSFGSTTVFRADHPTMGSELWKTDGTASGTTVVKDINPTGSSTPIILTPTIIGRDLFFTADDGRTGKELWKTDGTAAGTTLAFDVNPGPGSGFPLFLHQHGSSIYFSAVGSTATGRELWIYAQQTARLLSDILPGPNGASPFGMTSVGNRVVFTAAGPGGSTPDVEPYVTDGTVNGTSRLKDIFPGSESSSPFWYTAVSPSKVLFAATDDSPKGKGRELWETDGTPAGTSLLSDISPAGVTDSSSPSNFSPRGDNRMLMQADDGKSGSELWIVDATGGTTKSTLVVDINPGDRDSNPGNFCFLPTSNSAFPKPVTLFTATHFAFGTELWRTDGTAVGTGLVRDIRYGPPMGVVSGITTCGDKAYFAGNDGFHGTELWCSDGTRAGTNMVQDLQPGSASSHPGTPIDFRGVVYLAADVPGVGRELCFITDTTGGAREIKVLKDLYPGPTGSDPENLLRFDNHFLFTARAEDLGVELWISDGTESGTMVLYDTAPGPRDGAPSHLTQAGDKLFFVADDGLTGRELWFSDLTTFGTEMVKDIYNGSAGSLPNDLVWAKGRLFFSAMTDSNGTGRELFSSDGTDTGTGIVADINPGPASSAPNGITAGSNGVFFSASTAEGGRELYYSDGSGNGTRVACDLYPGQLSSHPTNITSCNGSIYFSATTYRRGVELHRISGLLATVERLGEGCGAESPTLHSTPPVAGKTMSLGGYSGHASRAHLLVIGILGSPTYIPGLVADGCSVWTNLGFPIAIMPHAPGPRWSMNLLVPISPNFLGRQVVLQGVYSPTPLSMTNGLLLTLGQ